MLREETIMSKWCVCRGRIGIFVLIALIGASVIRPDTRAQAEDLKTIVPGPRPDDSETFDAGFGSCETYEPRPSGVPTNFPYCKDDTDPSTGKSAFEECPNACLNTEKLGLQLKIANMQWDCLFGGLDVSQYGMTCNDIGMVPRIATEIPTCTAEEGFYQPIPEISDIPNSNLGSNIIFYTKVIYDTCMSGEGLWGRRAQTLTGAEPRIFCSTRAIEMIVEQYSNCNLPRNAIMCGYVTGKADNPCTPWLVDIYDSDKDLIQDPKEGTYKNRAGYGCDAPHYVRSIESQKLYCDQCTPSIEIGKTTTSYANIQDPETWDLEYMGYYCGAEGYDTCDGFLEEHPYGGEYTARIDSVTAWVQKLKFGDEGYCPEVPSMTYTLDKAQSRLVPPGEDPIETWLNIPPFDDAWAPYTQKATP